MCEFNIAILNTPLDVNSSFAWVQSPGSGGVNIFVGTVRAQSKGKNVLRLEFESYDAMALNEMKKIATEAAQKWQLHKVLIHHRKGVLQVGEVPVIIAVSSTGRIAAFEACRFIIDTLKEKVPIWKREVFEDGAEWVAAHP